MDINYKDLPAVRRLVKYTEARHITARVLDVLHDYYRDSGVEIHDETDLPDLLTSEIMTCLFELK